MKTFASLIISASLIIASPSQARSLFMGPFVTLLTPVSDTVVLNEHTKATIKQHSRTFERLEFHICATASIGSKKAVKTRLKSLTTALRAEGVKRRAIVVGNECLKEPSDAAVLFIQPIFKNDASNGSQ